MNFIRTVFSELLGLFVDDGSLALGILIWVGITAGLLHLDLCPPAFTGVLVFAGLAALLLENVLRRARRARM